MRMAQHIKMAGMVTRGARVNRMHAILPRLLPLCAPPRISVSGLCALPVGCSFTHSAPALHSKLKNYRAGDERPMSRKNLGRNR